LQDLRLRIGIPSTTSSTAKGKGVIMLLAGPPGVGKTLTAEAVAEQMQVPLIKFDIGSNNTSFQESMNRILDLAGRWKAVLLLDECDVFLESRTVDDLERNRIVSMFLQKLEYYEGILFLTTNRPDNIDPAIRSRIHLTMQYKGLTASSRRKVWCNFLKPGLHSLSDDDFDGLVAIEMNGRQIKNVVKMAQLLARRHLKTIDRAVLDTVLETEGLRIET
jgi:SpoVK/Ycf46/Vps4 family AAA+-type ATPase